MNNKKFRVAEGLEEGIHYQVVKDGHGVEYPVAIASHETFMPRKSGIVYIEAIRIAVNEGRSDMQGRRDDIETRSRFRCVKDKATGLYFGIPIGVHDTDKTVKWQNIPISPREPYDLSKPEDREKWAMLSRMSNLLGSPNQFGAPLYKVIDEEKKSINFLEIYKLKKDACGIVEGLDMVMCREMALNVGINADAFSPVMLQAELLKFADKNAEKFLNIWNNPKRNVISIFNRAIKYGVIEHNTRGDLEGKGIGYYYNNIYLGDNEGQVVSKLAEANNAAILSSISVAASARESQVKNGLSHEVKPAEKVINIPAVDPEKEAMAKKIAELEAKLKGGAPVTEAVAPAETSVAPVSDELKALREEAKALGVPKWHILGPDKLKSAIAAKKLQTQS